MTHSEIRQKLRVSPTWFVTDSTVNIGYILGEFKPFYVTHLQMAVQLKLQGLIVGRIEKCPCAVFVTPAGPNPITQSVGDFLKDWSQSQWIEFLVNYEEAKQHNEQTQEYRQQVGETYLNDLFND